MKIIAGNHKGRKLASLPGKTTRPTSGKVREAIFSIVADRIEDAAILDLFAGTGAFGLEAISRGASHAVFIDSDRKGIEVIRKNITACGENDRSTVLAADVAGGLRRLALSGGTFDLVFMDPPYNRQAVQPALESLAASGILARGAIVAIEHDKNEKIPEDIVDMEVTDRRKYGKTLVTFMKRM